MVIKQTIAYGIVESIEKLWKDQEFQDFTVIVDGTEVKCHSFLLAACSDFFKALLRSGMKEALEMSVTLTNISKETFDLIMQAIYTGSDIITEDNVYDIWHATHQLQIQFLVRECETFWVDNVSLDNYEKVYKNAKMLDSSAVQETVHKFMEKYFEDFWKTETFLELGSDVFISMVSSQDLVVSSEDIVIESILKWVMHEEIQSDFEGKDDGEEYKSQESDRHGTSKSENLINQENTSSDLVNRDFTAIPKEATSTVAKIDTESQDKHKQVQENRMLHIAELMDSARLCLASPDCLEMLLKNILIMENHDVKRTVHEAILYQLQVDRRHGLWVRSALHRKSSNFTNGLAYITNKHVVWIHDPYTGKRYKLAPLPNEFASGRGMKVVVFDNKLYAMTNNSLRVYKQNKWREIIDIVYRPIVALVSCGNFIFTFDEKGQNVSKLNLRSVMTEFQQCTSCPDIINICSVTHFDKRILVFSDDTISGADETVVHCFDPRYETWTRLNNIEGPAEQIAGTYDGNEKYILQTTGKLWRITKDEADHIDFSFCCQLWDSQCQLWGACFCGDIFFIFGEKSRKDLCANTEIEVSGKRKDITFWKHPGPSTSIFPVIIPNSWLQPKKAD